MAAMSDVPILQVSYAKSISCAGPTRNKRNSSRVTHLYWALRILAAFPCTQESGMISRYDVIEFGSVSHGEPSRHLVRHMAHLALDGLPRFGPGGATVG